jgi:rod shape determining protein RodA
MEVDLSVERKTIFKRIDWNLVIVVLVLNFVGLINLYSATHGPHSLNMEPLFVSQIIWLLIGWTVFFALTFIDYQFIGRLAFLGYTVNIAALVFVSVFGMVALGARRWIDFGFFKYQPSETIKLVLILVLARLFATRASHEPMGLRLLFFPVLLIAIPFVLVFRQPDLGTSMMIAAITGTILLFLRIKKWILVLAAIGGITAAPVAWKFFLKDYQKDRVLNFITPSKDPRGSGYNSIQSKIAVGSGKFIGKGFRKGTQSQLEFLPERHTDFIYSVLSEEHGFLGSMLTLTLFIVLFLIMIRTASSARDRMGAYLSVGVFAYIFWHMFINIGMVIGLLPIVGVPLPLLSYGGSGTLTTMAGLGLVSSVAYRRYIF